MSTTPPKSFRVAIVGAGLGGLFLAIFLQKNCPHVQVDIYESTHELTEVGAGIGMFTRVWEILQTLDIEEDLLSIMGNPESKKTTMSCVKGDEPKKVEVYEFENIMRPFHRSQLQILLSKNIRSPDQVFHFSKRLVSYVDPASSTEPIVLRFKDGTEATCDLLVGSDGIRSAVRYTMYANLASEAGDPAKAGEMARMAEPSWSGAVVYRGLVPFDKIPAEDLAKETKSGCIFLGKNQSIIQYPIARLKVVNVAAFVSTPGGEGTKYDGEWVAPANVDDIAAKFASWDPEVPRFLKLMQNPLLWAVQRVRHLPTFVKGRVAIMGDAAHAMTPFQASGAGQAIEDAFILANLLAQPSFTLDKLPVVLKVYDEVRRPFSQDIQRRSDENGRRYHLQRGGWENVTVEQSASGNYDPEILKAVSRELQGALQWAQVSANVEKEKALKLFKEELEKA